MSNAPRISRPSTPIPIRPPHADHLPAIPRPLTSFFGRDQERSDLAALIDDHRAPLVTLIGPAGVGKTRLALRVAEDLQPRRQVVAFVSLAPVTDPARVVPAIGETLGIRDPAIERIADRLRGAPALLMLDNLEQIPGVAQVVADLLAGCPQLTILATSRTVLNVSGEHVYPVRPFATTASTPDDLASTPSVRLFVDRAQAADASFVPDQLAIDAVIRICQELDGLPLAIELAAGQVRTLTPPAILARLDRRLDVLTHGPNDHPARHRSLDQAIRWSYDLLSAEEQQIVRRLAVFSGGFDEAAAAHVGLGGASPALPVLARLIDASLLVRTVQADGESRFAMLATIREFCLRELDVYGETQATRQAHANYVLAQTAAAEYQLISDGSAAWVRRLASDHANLRDAVDWSLATGQPEPVLALAGTLLSMAYAQGEPAEAGEWLERAIAMAGPDPTPAISDALFVASALAQVQGAIDRSSVLATRALDVARAANYPFGEGRALLGLGIGAEWLNDLDHAEQSYRAAHAVMRTIDPSDRLAHWRVLPTANLADIALVRGAYREAIALGDQAVREWRAAAYLWGIAQALGTVAAARCQVGDLEGARRDYQETLDLWIACADGRGIAGTIAGIAAVAMRLGQTDRALCLAAAAWSLRTRLGIEFVAHHLYAEQVRTEIFHRSASSEQVRAALTAGERLSYEEAIDAARAVLGLPIVTSRRAVSSNLSPREREVLICIGEGMHDREIASHLSISPRTVQTHVVGILNKLGARSRAEAVAIAIRNGLL